jgi:hypothetical protein
MKSAVAFALICALSTPTFAAAQSHTALWSNVRLLSPGARLTLSRRDTPARDVFLITVDDTEIVALNLPDDLTVSRGVKRALIRTASEQPEQLLSIRADRSMRISGLVVLSTSGLFDGDRKLADYALLIQHISRTDVDNGDVRVENVSPKAPMPTSTKVWIGVGITFGVLIGTLAILFRNNP